MKAETADKRRAAEIRLIHVARRELAMADDVYRKLLREIGGVASSSDLSATGRQRLLDHFARLGFVSTARQKLAAKGAMRGTPDRASLLAKIDALLLAEGRDRRYIEPGLVRRICKVDALAFCTPEQLTKLVAALTYDQRRKEGR